MYVRGGACRGSGREEEGGDAEEEEEVEVGGEQL